MKTALSFITILLTFTFCESKAQSFSLQTIAGNQVNNGDTILIGSSSLYASLTGDLLVVNNSGSTKFVIASKTYLNVLPGTFDVFSFDTYCCLAPFVFTIPGSVEMIPGSGPKNFQCNYQDNGFAGSSYILYSFYDENNPSDKIEVVYHFEVTNPTGFFINSVETDFSVFPNPSKGDFKVKFSVEKSAVTEAYIYNSSGQIIMKQQVSEPSQLNLDLRTQPQGIYTVILKNADFEILGNLRLIKD